MIFIRIIIEGKKFDLHWTLSALGLEETFPRLLCATHWYSPLSVLSKLIIVSCSFKLLRETLEFLLVFSGEPFTVQDTVGVGLPSTKHDKDTSVPSTGLVSGEVIFG